MIRNHVALALLLLLATRTPAQDLIRLKTGAKMEGIITEQTETMVTLEFEGGTIQLGRDQIAEITARSEPGMADQRRALLTLSRFQDHDSFHFLYRNGKRCGYRTLSLRREAREGMPGYAMRDRLVFMTRPGAMPDVDLQITEFVDAELRPVRFESRLASGKSARVAQGRRQGDSLSIKESSGNTLDERTALFRNETEFPRMLLRRLASEPTPEGGYPSYRVFRPRDVTFGTVSLSRRIERLMLRGRVKDILVFEHLHGSRPLETWLDMAGHVVREEIGSPNLISLRAPKSEVLGWARGEAGAGEEDLGLEFVSEPTGLRLLRPDRQWEVAAGVENRGAVVSLLRPNLRATVDVIHIDDLAEDATEEGVALDVLARMERHAKGLEVDGPKPTLVGTQKGLRFVVRCRRRKANLTTLGSIFLQDGRAFVILCAAPDGEYQKALPAFLELLESVQMLNPAEPATSNPFQKAWLGR